MTHNGNFLFTKENLCPAKLAVGVGVCGNSDAYFNKIGVKNIFKMGFRIFPCLANLLRRIIAPADILACLALVDTCILEDCEAGSAVGTAV